MKNLIYSIFALSLLISCSKNIDENHSFLKSDEIDFIEKLILKDSKIKLNDVTYSIKFKDLEKIPYFQGLVAKNDIDKIDNAVRDIYYNLTNKQPELFQFGLGTRAEASATVTVYANGEMMTNNASPEAYATLTGKGYGSATARVLPNECIDFTGLFYSSNVFDVHAKANDNKPSCDTWIVN